MLEWLVVAHPGYFVPRQLLHLLAVLLVLLIAIKLELASQQVLLALVVPVTLPANLVVRILPVVMVLPAKVWLAHKNAKILVLVFALVVRVVATKVGLLSVVII